MPYEISKQSLIHPSQLREWISNLTRIQLTKLKYFVPANAHQSEFSIKNKLSFEPHSKILLREMFWKFIEGLL